MKTDRAPANAIEVEQLYVELSGKQILRGVDLVVPKGQIVALIGPNGAGKTTLLRCLLGLEKPVSGRIRLLGHDKVEEALPDIGYVPQRLMLDGSLVLTVREFLSLRLRQTRHWFWKSRKATDAQLLPLLVEMGVEHLLDHAIAHLSGGQLQRVLIAFSLLNEPRLLLLDEPTEGVDAPGELTFYELIAALHQRRPITVMLVSHDLSMVYRYASWVYALNGVVCCEGSPDKVMNEESLKQAYGIHRSPYHHHHGHPH